MYKVCEDTFYALYPPFDELSAHFLDVEGYGKEGKVHRDLVFPEVAETSICHIVLHLSEDGFGLNAPSSSLPDTFLGSEPFPCLSLVFVEPVVNLYDAPVRLCLVAPATEWASIAVLRSIACACGEVSACGLSLGRPGAFHVLPHGTDVIVFLLVVIQAVLMERIRCVARTLFQMEAVVLDIGLHAGFLHEAVVLFRAIPRVGNGGDSGGRKIP